MDQTGMLFSLWILVVLALNGLVDSVSVTSEEEDDRGTRVFTDQWAVHITGGDQVADAIAARHGFTNLGKVLVLIIARDSFHITR